jgi:ribosomal protein S18 acetylase RimI-like enzyme
MIVLEPASRWSYAELAEIFNAGYEGYFTPFTLDEASFRFMSTTWDDDLDASRVAVVEGEPAGICKLAIRGDQGWIAGIGVAVPHRGEGLGEALMRGVIDEARTRGIRDLWLEVLVQNEPAIRLYEKLGFETVRELEVWTLEPLVLQEHKVSTVPAATAHQRIQAERTWREPWQRADESVANYENVEGLESEGGAVLFRRSGERVSLLQGAAAG